MPGNMKDIRDRRRYSNAVRLGHEKQVEKLADQLINGEITLKKWQTEMKKIIREAHKLQFVTGKGGNKKNIKPGDYGKIGATVKDQYKFLADFAQKIYEADRDGRSLEFIRARSKLYMKSSQITFWRSAVPVKLPQVPRDGGTACKSNCKCYLDFETVQDAEGNDIAVNVWWKLRPAEHCDDCKKLAREWSPRRFEVKTSLAPFRQALVVALHMEDETFMEVLDLWRVA